MTFAWDNGLVYFIVSLVLILAIFGGLFFVLFKVAKRKVSFIFLGIALGIFLVAFIFNLFVVAVLAAFVAAACLAVTFFANLGDLRKFIANPFSRQVAKAANFGIDRGCTLRLPEKGREHGRTHQHQQEELRGRTGLCVCGYARGVWQQGRQL